MKKEEIINLLEKNLKEIIPELEGEKIGGGETLLDLGANSIDRGELITITLEELELDVSRIEFVGCKTLEELGNLMVEKLNN